MKMTQYLLDTNHASRLMSGDVNLTGRLQLSVESEHRFGLSTTVLAELYYAVYAGQRTTQNLPRLRQMVGALLFWSFDIHAAEEFGKIQAEQRAKGRPIPPMDTQIAAVARVHGLTLLSADRHFQWIDRLAVENWLT